MIIFLAQFCDLYRRTEQIIYQLYDVPRNLNNQLTLFSGNGDGLAGGEAEFIKQVTF
ncbi:hypothetical protein RHO14_07930 [Orbus wheelerorum]